MIQWNEKFSVGIKIIDEQHKRLIEMVDEISTLIQELNDEEDRYDEIVALISALQDYTVYHFETEEALFEGKDYLQEAVHKFQHKLFVQKMQSVDFSKVDQDQKEFLRNLMSDLLQWIQDHILDMDMTYVGLI